jgi:hypothetical protein
VVRSSKLGQVLKAIYPRENLVGIKRMAAHFDEFRGGKLAGLVENEIGDAELAHVMDQRSAADVANL